MSELVEQVARAIAPVVLTYIEDYDEVPPDHIWTRPRYHWLSFAMTKIATAALSVIESRVRAEERDRAARILDERAAMYRAKAERHDLLADDTLTEHERFISNAEATEWGAAAIRSGDAG